MCAGRSLVFGILLEPLLEHCFPPVTQSMNRYGGALGTTFHSGGGIPTTRCDRKRNCVCCNVSLPQLKKKGLKKRGTGVWVTSQVGSTIFRGHAEPTWEVTPTPVPLFLGFFIPRACRTHLPALTCQKHGPHQLR